MVEPVELVRQGTEELLAGTACGRKSLYYILLLFTCNILLSWRDALGHVFGGGRGVCSEDCPGGMAAVMEGVIVGPWVAACQQCTWCRRHRKLVFVLLPPKGKVARVQSCLKASEQLHLPKTGMSWRKQGKDIQGCVEQCNHGYTSSRYHWEQHACLEEMNLILNIKQSNYVSTLIYANIPAFLWISPDSWKQLAPWCMFVSRRLITLCFHQAVNTHKYFILIYRSELHHFLTAVPETCCIETIENRLYDSLKELSKWHGLFGLCIVIAIRN